MVRLALAKRLTCERGEDTADLVIAFTRVCTVASEDTKIALAAVKACRAHGLANEDAIVFATARAHDADLLTCDHHFEGLPGVLLVPET